MPTGVFQHVLFCGVSYLIGNQKAPGPGGSSSNRLPHMLVIVDLYIVLNSSPSVTLLSGAELVSFGLDLGQERLF